MHDGRTRRVDSIDPGQTVDFLESNCASLTMISGPASGTEYALEGARSIAGRSKKAEIQIDDPSVSSEHAAFELDANGFGVRDLASTNGVLVNDQEVLSSALQHGDRIRLGDCEMQYVVVERARSPKAWSLEEAV